METNSRPTGRAARVVIWVALAVATTGAVLWYVGVIERLAPIVAGAAAVVGVTAGAVMRSRRGRTA